MSKWAEAFENDFAWILLADRVSSFIDLHGLGRHVGCCASCSIGSTRGWLARTLDTFNFVLATTDGMTRGVLMKIDLLACSARFSSFAEPHRTEEARTLACSD